MRKRLGEYLRLGVARGALCLLTANRWRASPGSVLAECDLPGAAGLTGQTLALGLETLFGADSYSGWPLSVVLDDSLARLWQVTPPPQASRVADLEAATRARFQHLYGESDDGWAIAASWDSERAFVAAAMPLTLLATLNQFAVSRQIRLVQIQPQFILAWNVYCKKLPASAWFGVVQEQVLMLGVTEADRLVAVRATRVPTDAGQDWLAAHLAREALRLGVGVPGSVHLCGHVPPSWANAGVAPDQIACTVLALTRAAAAHALAATGGRA